MIFLNSASSAAALVFYLTGVCTHTDTEGKQSSVYSKKIGKNTIFNRHPVDDGTEPKEKGCIRDRVILLVIRKMYLVILP